MKRILSVLALIAAIALISGNKQSGKDEIAVKISKPVITADYNGLNNSVLNGVKINGVSFSTGKVKRGMPGILLILTDDKEKSTGSPSPLWNYLIGKSGQSGC